MSTTALNATKLSNSLPYTDCGLYNMQSGGLSSYTIKS